MLRTKSVHLYSQKGKQTNILLFVFERILGASIRMKTQVSAESAIQSSPGNMAGPCLFEESQKHVRPDTALVRLVQHNDRVVAQQRVRQQLAHQHAVGHVNQPRRAGGRHVLEPNAIANLPTEDL